MPADKQRAEFMAHVSHDLKTPLNAVIGFTSVLLQDPKTGPDKRHQLQLVYDSARLLLSRIDALCNFYRMEGGVIVPEKESLQTAGLLSEIGESFRPAAEKKGLVLQIQAPGSATLNLSSRLLRFVLEELLANAIKYTPSGTVTLEASGDAATTAIAVADSGPGIKAETLESIRASLAGEGWDGLGLGLALARQAALLMGAQLEVESSDAGSRFTLVLGEAGQ